MKEDREIVPLRTILQNCLNHIENLESNRAICDNYEKEFQDLKQFSETLKTRKEYACTEGEKEVNRKKNRYKDILPFNVTRVILSEYAGIPGSDYINANFIKGASGSPAYIASQGPLPNTVNDFWRMVVECEIQVIVMACNAEEAGKHKCENYWVEKEGEEKRFGMVEICLVKASTVCPDFLVRTMRLKYTNDKAVTEERTICQFHYSAWPDHGVPPLVRPLLDMVRLVRDTQASETLPVLVHCSAGCGRTGTICAIDFVWGLLRAGKLTEEFSLFNLVKDMRKQRVAMVQTKEQYILVHQAVRELFKEQLRVIESHPYENIDVNGVPLIKDFEEPLYDTIGPCKDDCDEKQDNSEIEKKEAESKEISLHVINKPDAAPPLPRKKRPNVPFSKQEKEVENQTQKNKSTFSDKEKEPLLDVSPSNSLLSKPRIAKLKALFERSPTNRERNSAKQRGSQTVSRSHSLGAVRKPLLTEAAEPDKKPLQPIPDGGKLKVPKLSLSPSAVISRPVPLIKRSKSLKIVSQAPQLRIAPKTKPEQQTTRMKKSTTARDLIRLPEPNKQRRRSLESLMGDEPPAITWPKDERIENVPDEIYQKPPIKKPVNESLKQQFQNLTIEAQKKVNLLAAGIGVRERRNSFRQAISKDETRNPYEHIWLDPKKNLKKVEENNTIQVDGYPKNYNENLVVRNQNGEILQPTSASQPDQVDGIVKRNVYERIDFVPNYDKSLQRAKTQVIRVNSDAKYPLEPKRTDSRNLFLQRLNVEIREEKRNRTEPNRLWRSNPSVDDKLTTKLSETSRIRTETEPVKNYPRNANFLGIHAYKPEVHQKPEKLNPVYKQTLESSELVKKIDHLRSKEPTWSNLKVLKQKTEPDVKNYQQNDYYATSYDLYTTVNSQKSLPKQTLNLKISTLKPQITVDIRSRNLNRPSGSNSLSSHSSGDLSHSERHSPASDSSRIQEQCDLDGKFEVLRGKAENSKWINESSKNDQESESSSSSSARELSSVMNAKPRPEPMYNYGIVARVKLRQNKNQSRDDFLLGEPVAPPRVKRHASVMVPRHSMIETSSSQLSSWSSASNKFINDNAWNGSIGIDLDAVAASMQRTKNETGVNETIQHSKNHSNNSTPPQPTFRKQQQYL